MQLSLWIFPAFRNCLHQFIYHFSTAGVWSCRESRDTYINTAAWHFDTGPLDRDVFTSPMFQFITHCEYLMIGFLPLRGQPPFTHHFHQPVPIPLQPRSVSDSSTTLIIFLTSTSSPVSSSAHSVSELTSRVRVIRTLGHPHLLLMLFQHNHPLQLLIMQ